MQCPLRWVLGGPWQFDDLVRADAAGIDGLQPREGIVVIWAPSSRSSPTALAVPPRRVLATGTPTACASIRLTGVPSLSEVSTTTSLAAQTASVSRRNGPDKPPTEWIAHLNELASRFQVASRAEPRRCPLTAVR